MKVYTCAHDGVYLGGYSVIIARDEDHARELMDAELIRQHLEPYAQYPYTLHEVSQRKPQVVVLFNGDY